MICTVGTCGGETRVTTTRARYSKEEGASVVRYRECQRCERTVRTIEYVDVAEDDVANVLRPHREPEAFKESKVRDGIVAALDKSIGEVPQSVVDRIVRGVVHQAQPRRGRTVTTHEIGTIVLEELKRDTIIFAVNRIRFAIGFLRLTRMSDLGDWLQDPANWPSHDPNPLEHATSGEVTVRKRGRFEPVPWDQGKLERSIQIAARSFHPDKKVVEDFARRIATEVRGSLHGHSLVLTEQISSEVMRTLRAQGAKVPYLRYATAVKRMRNWGEFWDEFQDLQRDDVPEWTAIRPR
ncbi:ATP cone domain-containing protein [Kineococcus sp. GCM10028916]|uniref:ATP cone domain-containing protein n=1 Tax=Kineococcus sp. GCM10028916 TaxID=3273394 RepID=UPI003625A99E